MNLFSYSVWDLRTFGPGRAEKQHSEKCFVSSTDKLLREILKICRVCTILCKSWKLLALGANEHAIYPACYCVACHYSYGILLHHSDHELTKAAQHFTSIVCICCTIHEDNS